MNSSNDVGRDDEAESPDTRDLQEPSTEKEPDEEPKAPAPTDAEPSHEAVGIGIVGRPQVEPETRPDATGTGEAE